MLAGPLSVWMGLPMYAGRVLSRLDNHELVWCKMKLSTTIHPHPSTRPPTHKSSGKKIRRSDLQCAFACLAEPVSETSFYATIRLDRYSTFSLGWLENSHRSWAMASVLVSINFQTRRITRAGHQQEQCTSHLATPHPAILWGCQVYINAKYAHYVLLLHF